MDAAYDQNGITSIVIVTRNQLTLTKQCIDSIRRNTAAGSYELILVDNGSDDGTAAWAAEQNDVKVIANKDNAGFPKACNQGLQHAAGSFLLLLNNDTLVTPGWLTGLQSCLTSDAAVGAVGPVTNSASYWSTIPASYTTLEELDQFAVALRGSSKAPGTHQGSWEERIKLVGYCMLLKREAYEVTGELDERFGVGNFEDDDYSIRLKLAGYKLMLCKDTFIHHYGSASFREEEQLYVRTFEKNSRIFREKWDFSAEQGLLIRIDIAGLVEREAKLPARGSEVASSGGAFKLLELGCGCGATLLRLKSFYPGAELFGLERNAEASRVAAASGVQLLAGDELSQWAIAPGTLDGIVIGEAQWGASVEKLQLLSVLLKPGGWLAGDFDNRHYYRNLLRYLNPLDGKTGFQGEGTYAIEQVQERYEAAGLINLSIHLQEDGRENRDKRISEVEFAALERMIDTKYDVTGRLTSSRFSVYGQITADSRVSVLADTPEQSDSSVKPLAEQNDVRFSGERLVVNQEVKTHYADVYEEHLSRYELACRYVNGLRVLDAACGAGYGSAMLSQAGAVEVLGVDVDSDSVRLAERDYSRAGVRFATADVLALPFADEEFDAVISFETIEHVDQGAAWIAESARVLKAGGLFIVSTPNRTVTNPPLYYEEQPFNLFHRFEYRTAELAGELLVHYDIEAMYGQNPVDDSRFASLNWLRQMSGLEQGREASRIMEPQGHQPIPLSQFKSTEPMYVIAVCRKKRT
ncbi:methyltransferase domain-containing protein [Paenibacillus gorillae]|uniref:methyltransferase domain-containing protein n=1 Tax=Paenibacillus gorillae TaxID=1243662 RepID=UPI0004AF69B4|nr:methyltransferase domain-containing protein [Paenibacillus gorillae]